MKKTIITAVILIGMMGSAFGQSLSAGAILKESPEIFGKEIFRLDEETKFELLEKSPDYLKVKIGETEGYVSTVWLSKITRKYMTLPGDEVSNVKQSYRVKGNLEKSIERSIQAYKNMLDATIEDEGVC
ncbi:MAG: hypothetical protein ACC656_13800, partial [Candidatus Heimdallarchaeota archaeon]